MHPLKRSLQLIGMTLAMLTLVIGICGTLAISLSYLVDPGAYLSFFGDRDPAALRRPLVVAHIAGGMVALLTGLVQLTLRPIRHHSLHRWIGSTYMGGVFFGASAAIAMAPFSHGPRQNGIGFLLLGLLWAGATTIGIVLRWAQRLDLHCRWMIISYALTLAAVSLRLQLPLLQMVPGVGYDQAYAIVAWSSWVPNLIAVGLWQWRGLRRT